MFDREMAIQELVDNDFSDIYNLGQTDQSVLESILLNGFKGYNNFTNEELEMELNLRMLAYQYV
jgi:mevalonate pyrophosphate decarboxylase